VSPEDLEELYSDICNDLDDRKEWEQRQIIWHQMRGPGVRRSLKPWPGAADSHVPIGDTVITKIKAYYAQWIFGPELLASFYSKMPVGEGYTSSVARWFDYQVRQCSNFNVQTVCAIDSCLQNGLGILKIWWDYMAQRLCFTSVAPYFVIVPSWTTNLDTADRFTHVMQLSQDEYKRCAADKGYNTDKDYLDRITGEGKPDSKYSRNLYSQEGITFAGKDMIILWEVYVRDQDDHLMVHTFSPLCPEEAARESFQMPYRHKQIPFCIIPYELTDPGFYSSRGVMELVQMYEASASKAWNEKLDFMTIANRPVLSTQGGSINAQNIRWQPGAVYDSNLQLIQQPPPPVSFDQEIQSVRQMAEQRVGIPDFGIGQQNQPQKSRTATEVNQIGTVMQASNDLRARVVKGAIQEVYDQAWSILLQYKKEDLDYFWRKERSSLDPEAFSASYIIRPNGSSDGYSRETEIQKLQQLRQLSQGAPWIKTNEIDKKLIELFDAEWVGEVYMEPQEAMAEQQEKQAYENTIMYDGFPPPVWPEDDHVVHIQTIFGYFQFSQAHQRPIPPDLMMLYLQHAQQHVDAAKQNHQYFMGHAAQINQFASQIAQMVKGLQKQQMAAQQAGQAMGALRGGAPPGMGGPGMGGGPPAPPGVGAPPSAGMVPPPMPSTPINPPVPGVVPNGQNAQ
jgi:hypothetical protein